MTDSCTPEDFEYFLANKHLLEESIKEGKILKNKADDCAIGLYNAGSTCYLNSMIQCLFQSKQFRSVLCSAEDNSSPVVNELKRLFTSLVHSSRSAVATKDLLAAFGWTKGQTNEQHDVHEFYSVLLDAIGQGSKSVESKLAEFFQGVESDILQCSNCNFEKVNEATFRSIAVDIPDVLEGETAEGAAAESFSIVNLLSDVLKPETLDDQNKWECSSCGQKVCATKRHGFKSVPDSLVVQLKRFRFDPTTKKRRKLNTAIDFPEKIVPATLLQVAGVSTDAHLLTGIVVHMGTAMGGHYKAYVRSACDPTVWWECNDEVVTKLSAEDISLLFSADDNRPDSIQRATIMENAYLLLYSKLGGNQAFDEFPATEEIKQDNVVFESLVKLDKIRKQVSQCDISLQKIVELNPSENKFTLYFPRSSTVEDVTQKIYIHVTASGTLDRATYPIQMCRVRKFAKSGWGKGETFAGRENVSLAEAGFSESEHLCFEYRSPEDPEFVEFNPHDMILHIRKWTSIEDFSDPSTVDTEKGWVEILVPGRENADVGSLRNIVCSVLGLAANAFYLIPYDPSVPLSVMDDDSYDLRKKYKVFPGHHIIVEEKVGDSESISYVALKNIRSRVRLHFNNPFNSSEQGYENVLETRIDATLLEVKNQIASNLNIPNLDSFHLRKNESGPQFKDEGKTLADLELTDLSIVHIELGKGCNAGEHMLRFEIDLGSKATSSEEGEGEDASKAKSEANRYVLLDEIAVSEKSTIISIKRQLHSQWTELSEKLEKRLQALSLIQSIPLPASPQHIRLRDLKTGKVSGPLRDDRIASRCLLGLSDGRRIAVQILPNEEIIGPDDILITIRVASYDKKTLAEPHDMCIPRNFTVENLYDKIASTFPELAEPVPAQDGVDPATELPIEIAKGFTTGPAVSLKTALKLKWNDPAVMVEGKSSLVDRPPLNLRDGSIIVVRGRADWLRAQARVKAKREAEMAAGTGVSAVRAKSRAGTRGGTRGGLRNRMATSSTEPSLKIASGELSSNKPPHPDGIAGSPNENISENQLPQPSPTKLQ